MNAPAFQTMPGISSQVYSETDFRAVRDIIHREAGIVLAPAKAMLVYSRLAPLVRNTNCGTFANYIKQIQSDPVELRKAVCSLTTNHTFFYREAHHFEHLESQVRPILLRQLDAGRSVRLWSAGCSSGEESWSILMTLLGEDRAAARHILESDLLLLGSDIADHALTAARTARYPANGFDPVPVALRRTWVVERDGQAEIREEVRRLTRFKPLNLLGKWPMGRQFDVIFCRNVMIYFDQPTKEALISKFADALRPGGYLYIGHSERVTGPASRMLIPVGNTIYQRGDA